MSYQSRKKPLRYLFKITLDRALVRLSPFLAKLKARTLS